MASNAAKAAVAEIRAAGGIGQAETRATVRAMADGATRSPARRALLTLTGPRRAGPGGGRTSTPASGLRVMWDWITTGTNNRLVIVDYKTTTDASPGRAAKSSARYGYWMQDDWYRTAAVILGVHPTRGSCW